MTLVVGDSVKVFKDRELVVLSVEANEFVFIILVVHSNDGTLSCHVDWIGTVMLKFKLRIITDYLLGCLLIRVEKECRGEFFPSISFTFSNQYLSL